MTALKCSSCGLVNFVSAEKCKKCGATLSGAAGVGNFATGVWRDKKWLVKRLDARLDDHCIKCSSEAVAVRKQVRVDYFPSWTLLPLLLGYVVHKRIEVEIPLCRKHQSNWEMDLKINLPLILVGIGLLVLSFYLTSALALTAGILLFAMGCLASIIGGDPVSLKSYRAPYVWLKGAGETYLATLPPWTDPKP